MSGTRTSASRGCGAGPVPWEQAWHEALYGAAGFYRGAGPAAHFSTAAQGGHADVLAGALVEMARREGCTTLVDVGCGRGELLGALHAADPSLALLGVDVVPRPDGLPGAIGWAVSPGGATLPDELAGLEDTLVLAHEWLDVVPCAVAVVTDDGARTLLVDPATGAESLGEPLAGDALAWVERHWPLASSSAGDRVEVGLTRDRAWSDLVSRLTSGTALAVDYGHTRDHRPRGGTLTGFRQGIEVDPVPDGTCDLTAHVAVDSLDHDELHTQRRALLDLGVSSATPDRSLASTDPAAYLHALARSTVAGSLTAAKGFGGFAWAIKRVRD